MTTNLPDRIAGATLPDTHLLWSEDGGWVDLTGYTFEIEAAAASDPATILWTKDTGITGTAGGPSTPCLTIAWDPNDLGALPVGTYRLELTATLGGRARKHQFAQTIDQQI